jgi:hypothetical protein
MCSTYPSVTAVTAGRSNVSAGGDCGFTDASGA